MIIPRPEGQCAPGKGVIMQLQANPEYALALERIAEWATAATIGDRLIDALR